MVASSIGSSPSGKARELVVLALCINRALKVHRGPAPGA
jgi:hypothetical protein